MTLVFLGSFLESIVACARRRGTDSIYRCLALLRHRPCISEVISDDFSGSLGGGECYDNLVGMFSGKQVPAIGFSLGLERILMLM